MMLAPKKSDDRENTRPLLDLSNENTTSNIFAGLSFPEVPTTPPIFRINKIKKVTDEYEELKDSTEISSATANPRVMVPTINISQGIDSSAPENGIEDKFKNPQIKSGVENEIGDSLIFTGLASTKPAISKIKNSADIGIDQTENLSRIRSEDSQRSMFILYNDEVRLLPVCTCHEK